MQALQGVGLSALVGLGLRTQAPAEGAHTLFSPSVAVLPSTC